MNIIENLKNIFKVKPKDVSEQTKSEENYEIVMNEIDRCALYFKDREKKFVFIKDRNFPFMLNDSDIEFIDMNRDNFEYYAEFKTMDSMVNEILKQERREIIEPKNDESYLLDHLEYCNSNIYFKIIEKMKSFEIDKKQYNNLINSLKEDIKNKLEEFYDSYENSNPKLESNRTYTQIMDELKSAEEFFSKYPYKYYEDIRLGEGSISHYGYPDYMWQADAERNIYTFSTDAQ